MKRYHADILYWLLNRHPNPVSYDEVMKILKNHGLVITDPTRIHRKISELREFIAKFDPQFKNMIINIRGTGYGLSLQFKNAEPENENGRIKFASKKIEENILLISGLIESAISFTEKSEIISGSYGYIQKRDSAQSEKNIKIFNRCEKEILDSLHMHEADFIFLRIQYLLAKLKTYIGFVRISEFSISKSQWLEWFKAEVKKNFDELCKMIKESEHN